MSRKQPTLSRIFTDLYTTGLFLPVLVLSLILIVFWGVYTTSNTVREQKQISQSISQRITDYLKTATHDLDALMMIASSNSGDISYDALSQCVNATRASHDFFDSIYLINKNARIVTLSPLNKNYIGLDVSNQGFYIPTQQAEDYWISIPFTSLNTGNTTVFVSHAMQDGSMIVGELSLNKLQQVVNTEPIPVVGRVLYITDEFGVLLAHPQEDWVRQKESTEFSQGSAQDFNIFGVNFRIRNNQVYLVTSSPIEMTSWIVVSETPFSNLLSTFILMMGITFTCFLLVWLYMMYAIRWQTQRKVINPLQKLISTTAQLANNDFTHFPELDPIEKPFLELNQLSIRFQQMTLAVQSRQKELLESEEKYRRLIEDSNDAIAVEKDGRLIMINHRFSQFFDVTQEQIETRVISIFDFFEKSAFSEITSRKKRLLRGELRNLKFDFTAIAHDGSRIEFEASSTAFEMDGSTAVQFILHDITARKQAEQAERKQRILAEALLDSTAAIIGTLQINEVMDRILNNIGRVIPHHASTIMIIDEDHHHARIVALRGFADHGLQDWDKNFSYNLDEVEDLKRMYTHRTPMVIGDTREFPGWVNFPDTPFLRSCVEVPIKIKSQVYGFINLYSDIPNSFTSNDAEKLLGFSDQAAIAIQNIRLLNELQEKNFQLTSAYDTTLQGWSDALELRDYETEGHSRRVVDLTLQLARRLGTPEDQLQNIRYGVLLHDIGKIGIPDSILSKPGPLTASEWKIMRKHPEYAYQILSKIPYLSAALDIPYCHHEHWNGSGYPRGLKMQEIPRAARIFTIVDVWDGLSYDRPYRKAWDREAVTEYIREQSGILFDPEITSEFLKMVEEMPSGKEDL